MSSKMKTSTTTPSTNPQTLKIGGQVRCTVWLIDRVCEPTCQFRSQAAQALVQGLQTLSECFDLPTKRLDLPVCRPEGLRALR